MAVNFWGIRLRGAAGSGLLLVASAALGTAQGQEPAEIVLHKFAHDLHGTNPAAGLTGDPAGNLYGTTPYGGEGGDGVVFALGPAGEYTVLYSFKAKADGANPYAGVIRDPAGNLYGTTTFGGIAYAGVVYKLDTAGMATVLHNFTGGADGGNPYAGVIRDAAGNLYGTAHLGGTANAGVIYKLDPAGDFKVLHTFTGPDGASPYAGLIGDSAGNLYGTAYSGGTAAHGVVFKLNPVGGKYTVLYSFTGGTDGSFPYAGVIRDSAANLYGTTWEGGAAGHGVVYKLDLAGNESVLHSFAGGADGRNPYAGVIRDAAGNLYGTTTSGGTADRGVVYKLDLAGNETVLDTFTGATDGGDPLAGVIRGPAGNLFGTTSRGATKGGGVVFMLQGAAP